MILYRYTDHRVGELNEWGDLCSSRASISLIEYEVTKETPKGYWIGGAIFTAFLTHDKWVSKTSKKRYAHPTKDEAWASFQARKKRQILILSTRLKYAQEAAAAPRP